MKRLEEACLVTDDVRKTLGDVLALWNQMKTSHLDEAGDDADRFQMTFYQLMDHVQSWVQTLQNRPVDAEAARLDPQFEFLFSSLPDPLQIPFETELDAILSERDRQTDSTEQS